MRAKSPVGSCSEGNGVCGGPAVAHAFALRREVGIMSFGMRAQDLWLECYLLELPFDAGIPDNYVLHTKDDPTGAVEAGWQGFQLGGFLGIAPDPPTDQMRSTTLAFRRAVVPAISPLAAIEAAFPAILRRSQLAFPLWRRLWLRSPLHRFRLRLAQGPPQPRTVVAATRIAFPPPSEKEEAAWRGAQVDMSRRVLNEYLAALAGMRTNFAIGPIAAPELPPVVFGYRLRLPAALAGVREHYEPFVVAVHEHLRWATEPLTWEQAETGSRAMASDRPFMRAMSWMREAERSLIQETPLHAIVEACTAIEIAVSDAVRACGPAAGYEPAKFANILEGAFASRVKDQFARLLGFSSEVLTAHDALATWWRDGYLRRN